MPVLVRSSRRSGAGTQTRHGKRRSRARDRGREREGEGEGEGEGSDTGTHGEGQGHGSTCRDRPDEDSRCGHRASTRRPWIARASRTSGHRADGPEHGHRHHQRAVDPDHLPARHALDQRDRARRPVGRRAPGRHLLPADAGHPGSDVRQRAGRGAAWPAGHAVRPQLDGRQHQHRPGQAQARPLRDRRLCTYGNYNASELQVMSTCRSPTRSRSASRAATSSATPTSTATGTRTSTTSGRIRPQLDDPTQIDPGSCELCRIPVQHADAEHNWWADDNDSDTIRAGAARTRRLLHERQGVGLPASARSGSRKADMSLDFSSSISGATAPAASIW